MAEALVMIFPHKACAWQEEQAKEWARNINFGMEIFSQAISELEETVQRISQSVSKVYSILWENELGRTPPLIPRFDCLKSTRFTSSAIIDVLNKEWIRPPDFARLATKIPETEILVGGFHYDDCVSKFIKAAQQIGKKVRLSPALTDLFYSVRLYSKLLEEQDLIELPERVDPRLFQLLREKTAQKIREEFLPGLVLPGTR